jgi:hypothetical protein
MLACPATHQTPRLRFHDCAPPHQQGPPHFIPLPVKSENNCSTFNGPRRRRHRGHSGLGSGSPIRRPPYIPVPSLHGLPARKNISQNPSFLGLVGFRQLVKFGPGRSEDIPGALDSLVPVLPNSLESFRQVLGADPSLRVYLSRPRSIFAKTTGTALLPKHLPILSSTVKVFRKPLPARRPPEGTSSFVPSSCFRRCMKGGLLYLHLPGGLLLCLCIFASAFL